MNDKVTNKLSLFSLVMITVISVDSIRNLPAAALFGSQLIVFYIIGALLFLLPCAFVSAELASTFPDESGIYSWVKHALGQQFALLAIWLQWIENVIWYPTLLSFVAGTVGYLIDPSLATNKVFLVTVILVAFWGCTLINLKGIESSAKFSSFCSIAGLIIPMSIIIAMGTIWLFQGKTIHISFSAQDLFPNFSNSSMWVALTGIMISFCGMEIATVHARETKDPQTVFPKALIISASIILATLILGSITLALVIPAEKISLVAGIMQALDILLKTYNLSWLLPIMGLTLVIGSLGSVSNWIIAPTKGLQLAAQDGLLPKHLRKTNSYGAPSSLLIYQAVIVTFLNFIFLLLPSVNGSYWFLTVLAVQLYMFMYVLMFISAIILRFKYPNHPRTYQIPGKFIPLSIVCLAGLIGSILTFAVGYIPPSNIDIGDIFTFRYMLIVGFILLSLPPFISYYYYSRREKPLTPKQITELI